MAAKITLDTATWKLKLDDRSRGRMKITFKLNQTETQKFKVWNDTVRPPNVTEEQFFKQIFFYGMASLNEEFEKIAKKIAEDPELQAKMKDQKTQAAAVDAALTKLAVPDEVLEPVYDIHTKKQIT